jgi:glyoxylase-like metal-dependent hydrolase (beta-lactamase superfamily II)
MKITDSLYLVGSGEHGLSAPGDCHVYFVRSDEGGVLIDAGCGDDDEVIIDNLKADGIDPGSIGAVLITHAHRDHGGGAAALLKILREEYSASVSVVSSREEAALFSSGSIEQLGLDLIGLGGTDRDMVYPPFDADTMVEDDEILDIAGISVRAVIVPGHNPACVCYLLSRDGMNMLFSGDVVMYGGFVSVGNWPGSDTVSYRENIGKLLNYDFDALLPGHFLWTLREGRRHVEKAIEAFKGLWPPPNFNTIFS